MLRNGGGEPVPVPEALVTTAPTPSTEPIVSAAPITEVTSVVPAAPVVTASPLIGDKLPIATEVPAPAVAAQDTAAKAIEEKHSEISKAEVQQPAQLPNRIAQASRWALDVFQEFRQQLGERVAVLLAKEKEILSNRPPAAIATVEKALPAAEQSAAQTHATIRNLGRVKIDTYSPTELGPVTLEAIDGAASESTIFQAEQQELITLTLQSLRRDEASHAGSNTTDQNALGLLTLLGDSDVSEISSSASDLAHYRLDLAPKVTENTTLAENLTALTLDEVDNAERLRAEHLLMYSGTLATADNLVTMQGIDEFLANQITAPAAPLATITLADTAILDPEPVEPDKLRHFSSPLAGVQISQVEPSEEIKTELYHGTLADADQAEARRSHLVTITLRDLDNELLRLAQQDVQGVDLATQAQLRAQLAAKLTNKD
jgi:hypothetical protein